MTISQLSLGFTKKLIKVITKKKKNPYHVQALTLTWTNDKCKQNHSAEKDSKTKIFVYK